MRLTRLQADCALAVAGMIWGFGFVAQKNALGYIGPFTFVASRFLISALFVLPLAWRENRAAGFTTAFRKRGNRDKILTLCAAFSFAVIIQQYGLVFASVTNAAFLTGLYVVMVPFVGRLLYGNALSIPVLIAGLLSVFGVWLLSGGKAIDLKIGDGLVLLCAAGFALHIAVMGRLAGLLRAPFALSCIQYLVVGIAALVLALLFERIEWKALEEAWLPILYAGLASGGIAYTLQSVAMQHTPSAEAAIILSSEALFGGIGGVWLLHEKTSIAGIFGCAAIIAAIALVELSPLWKKRRIVETNKRIAK